MSLGLSLVGVLERAGDPTETLRRLGELLRGHCGETLFDLSHAKSEDGHPALLTRLHPAAQDVAFVTPNPHTLRVLADTLPAGPGYHAWLCDLMDRVADWLEITWKRSVDDDGTGYFRHRDRHALEALMLEHLQDELRASLRLARDERPLHLMLPRTHTYTAEGRVLTAMGPRSQEWLEGLLADPVRAADAVPWWEPGQGARVLLNRALSEMWTDVRWRAPLEPEEEIQQLRVVHQLAAAWRLDPTLPFPWREWLELIENVGGPHDIRQEVERRVADTPEGPLIGYRRQPVRVHLPDGWSLELPGYFAESWEENATWCAWDGQRTLWFSAFSLSAGPTGGPDPEQCLRELSQIKGQRLEWRSTQIAAAGVLGHMVEDGVVYWQLSAQTARSGGLALWTLCFEDVDDRDWAIRTWQSVVFDPNGQPIER